MYTYTCYICIIYLSSSCTIFSIYHYILKAVLTRTPGIARAPHTIYRDDGGCWQNRLVNVYVYIYAYGYNDFRPKEYKFPSWIP